jgi:hypothetical protein
MNLNLKVYVTAKFVEVSPPAGGRFRGFKKETPRRNEGCKPKPTAYEKVFDSTPLQADNIFS